MFANFFWSKEDFFSLSAEDNTMDSFKNPVFSVPVLYLLNFDIWTSQYIEYVEISEFLEFLSWKMSEKIFLCIFFVCFRHWKSSHWRTQVIRDKRRGGCGIVSSSEFETETGKVRFSEVWECSQNWPKQKKVVS